MFLPAPWFQGGGVSGGCGLCHDCAQPDAGRVVRCRSRAAGDLAGSHLLTGYRHRW